MSETIYPKETKSRARLRTEVWISMYLENKNGHCIETYSATDSDGCMYYLKLNRDKGFNVVTWAISISKKDAERLLSHKFGEIKS